MRSNSRKLIVAGVTSLALGAVARAHPGHGTDLTWGFSSGFVHPFTGLDHILAMLAVGWWAAQLGGRARYVVPAAFVGMMTVGALMGQYGVMIPGVEQAIAASVLVLGVLVACSARLTPTVAASICGGFALFHGFAHGAELASGGIPAIAGFAAASILLQSAGIATAHLVGRRSPRVAAIAGSAIALCGALLLAA